MENVRQETNVTIIEKLALIQQTLKAPKGQYNSFSNYYYRNAEDIQEGLKPLLGSCTVTLSDKPMMIGDRYYIKACATFTDGNESLSCDGYAREADTRKGMDVSQLTGSSSSYARKYALNGLFLIDDTKDADSHESSQIERDVLSVMAMIKDNRIADIHKHWCGMITSNWDNLDDQTRDSLNALIEKPLEGKS